LFAGNANAQSSTIAVSAQANIFAAGLTSTPPDGGCAGSPNNGTLPIRIAVPAGITTMRVIHVTGTVGCDASGDKALSADGPCFGGGTNINADGGISGIVSDSNLFLTGVFLANGEPGAPAPASLNFTGDENFGSLSPHLRQTFFIGDGLTGTSSGATQVFHIPSGATRLYLGFADASGFHGAQGCYSDNSGSLRATVTFGTTPVRLQSFDVE
jgi:hypothetical protein